MKNVNNKSEPCHLGRTSEVSDAAQDTTGKPESQPSAFTPPPCSRFLDSEDAFVDLVSDVVTLTEGGEEVYWYIGEIAKILRFLLTHTTEEEVRDYIQVNQYSPRIFLKHGLLSPQDSK